MLLDRHLGVYTCLYYFILRSKERAMLRQEIWRSQWPTDQPKDTTPRRPSRQNQRPGLRSSQFSEFLATFWSCCTCCICILLCKFKLGKRGGNRTWKILWPEPQLQRDIMRLMRYLQFSALSLYGYTPYGLIWQACLTDHSRGSTVPAFASTASTTSTICKAGELFKGCNTQ